MTFKEVATMISGIGLPFAYYQFPEGTAQKTPFICYFYSGNNDVLADDSNYQKIEHLNIELYSDEKDFDSEAAIESARTSAGLVWSREETYIDDERLYMVLYEMDAVITPASESASLQEEINNGEQN